MVKDLPANARDLRDAGSITRLGQSPGGENGWVQILALSRTDCD